MSKQDIWQWLGPLAERWKGEANLREQSIVLTWRTVGLSSLAQAMYVDRGVLHLGVASHVVAAELNLLKRKVVARVKEAVPGAGITDLRFHIRAQAEQPGQIAVPAPTAAARRRARAELSPKLPTSLRAGLSEILAWAQAR
ncbi:TPA: hypothetical protein DCY67_04375, partial [Candidatus Acetothermia bacterium]|nr:hypothetical protein [Candidatus Acetothermia bacterium]